MKLRSALLVLVSSLVLGTAGPVFAADTSTARSDIVTSIQTQYNPLFDAQYARFKVLQKKLADDAGSMRIYKSLLKDFLDMRVTLNASLTSSTSDLDAAKSYAEEEVGEYDSSLSQLEAIAAKNKTITCVKAKLVKKISGVAPKCPTGYKKK